MHRQRPGQAGVSHHPSAGPHRRPQPAAVELGRHQRPKGHRGPAVPLGLLRRTDRPADPAGDRTSRQHACCSMATRRQSFALAFLDIDNFKHINDYYGHAVGDALLVEVAKRLGLDLRESDMLSRISGDEFLLLLQSDPERAGGGGIYRVHAAAAEGAVLHRRIGNIRLDLDRRQPLSRTRPQLRRCCVRTPISRCIASRTTARAPRSSSTPAWSARRWRG